MDLHVAQERTADGTRRVLRLDNLRNDAGRLEVSIGFDLIGERDTPPPRLLDGFVLGILFYAMRTGQHINVRGTMSHEAVRYLHELQEAWVAWRRERYSIVRIDADDIIEAGPTTPRQAIAAFSGGVDSTFTLLRHARNALGTATYPLKKTVLMVHGFDVPLRAPEHLAALQRRTAPLLQELGLECRIIRTNLKEAQLQDWEDSCGAQLACCLHNYSHEFAYGLIGSSEPYNALVLPWGSNPATDYLLSGAGFRIVHDGAGYSRTEKVEEIAKSALATRVVKVCWQGEESFRNCGHCSKCMRTRLNFLAVGMPNPACFDTPLDMKAIAAIDIRNEIDRSELISILTHANRRGLRD